MAKTEDERDLDQTAGKAGANAGPAPAVEDEAEHAEAAGTPHPPQAGPAPTKNPRQAAPAPAPARGGGGFLAPVAGGVVAAALGYGTAQYVGPDGWPFADATGPDDPVVAALRDTEDRLAAIEARLEALPTAESMATAAAPGLQEDLAALAERTTAMSDQMSGLGDQVTALSDQVTTFDGRLTELLKAPIEAAGGATAKALAAYEAEIAAMRAENAELAGSVRQLAEEANAEVGAAMDRAAQVEASAALMRIQAALASGDDFATALDQFGTIEVPEPLTAVAASGVATLAELQRDFPAAARAALKAALEAQASGDVGDRVGAFFQSQLGMRSLEPHEGDDADAILSRAEAALRTGELRVALAELESLPDVAKPAMSGWIDAAAARADALDAARQLEQRLNPN